MKNLLKLTLVLVLTVMAFPAFAQTPMSNSARNVTLQTPTNYLCFPLDSDGPATPIPYTCTGSATVVQSNTTWTSLTITIDRPVVGSQQIAAVVENFTTGNNLINTPCTITSGQKTCTITFSASASAGDVLAIKLFNNLTGTANYNIGKISWVLQ